MRELVLVREPVDFDSNPTKKYKLNANATEGKKRKRNTRAKGGLDTDWCRRCRDARRRRRATEAGISPPMVLPSPGRTEDPPKLGFFP